MKPFTYKMVGYMMDEVFNSNGEPTKHYFGKKIGWLPALYLRVYYPLEFENMDHPPLEKCHITKTRTRIMVFMIHPSAINQIKSLGKLKGRVVCVTFYLDSHELGKTILTQMHATRVEDILSDYGDMFVDKQQIFVDENDIEDEFNYDALQDPTKPL